MIFRFLIEIFLTMLQSHRSSVASKQINGSQHQRRFRDEMTGNRITAVASNEADVASFTLKSASCAACFSSTPSRQIWPQTRRSHLAFSLPQVCCSNPQKTDSAGWNRGVGRGGGTQLKVFPGCNVGNLNSHLCISSDGKGFTCVRWHRWGTS